MFKTVIEWHKIFRSAEEPKRRIPLNKGMTISVAGHSICIVHSPKGLRAISDRCPHNGFSLSRGWCTEDGEAMVCPLHRYAFQFSDGRAKSGFAGACLVYPLEERNDGLYLGIERSVLKWFS